MNKKAKATSVVLSILGVIFVIGLLSLMSAVGIYNNLINLDTSVENNWAKVQTAYQRRVDLIPNLVNTVKGVSNFEKDTQTEIAKMRSGIKYAQNPQDLNRVGAEMNSLISNLIVSVEAYPDLKSSQNFLALQDELAGTENRIKWERDNYNDAIKDYKIKVRSFPSNMVANTFGFSKDKWSMFEGEENAKDVPTVEF